jgi:hypothetical protein
MGGAIEWRDKIDVDVKFSEAQPNDYDGLLPPGA